MIVGKLNSQPSSRAVRDTKGDEEEDPDSSGIQLCEFIEFSETDVLKVIKGINVSKLSGIDNISSFVIKETFTALLPIITRLFNMSIRCSIFPQAWKDALIIPIPKAGDLSKLQNYRPISLLPLPGKLLEKLVLNS